MKNIISILIALSFLAFSQVTFAAEEVSSIARGGRLYDKWFAVIGAPKPAETHPAWPASNTKKKGNATHRCKSCHGWDLMGKDGAYASGSYKTGIKGLKNMQGASNAKVIAAMKDSTHGYAGKMSDQDFTDLANFVTKGQIDIDAIIDRKSKITTTRYVRVATQNPVRSRKICRRWANLLTRIPGRSSRKYRMVNRMKRCRQCAPLTCRCR
jgi:thiosulfate dehydrogenase